MDNAAIKYNTLSAEEYLSFERSGIREINGKNEFYNNQLKPIAGASPEHNYIFTNLMKILLLGLDQEQFIVFGSDMRTLSHNIKKDYFYPDIIVMTEPPQFSDSKSDILTNPSFIIEILSKTTEEFDRVEKFAAYRKIPQLKELILVSQDRPCIEQFYKMADGIWAVGDTVTDIDSAIHLKTLPTAFSLKSVYHRLNFNL